jgi:hypothetical protein
LAAVVLVSILVLTFLSRSVLNRKLSFSSAGQARAEMLSRMALDTITGDLRNEIVAGSDTDSKYTVNGVTIYQPLTKDSSQSMLPSRILPQADWKDPTKSEFEKYANLVKMSYQDEPFWEGDYFPSSSSSSSTPKSPVRSTANSTQNLSVNGRYIDKSRWNKPQLLSADISVVPDWIVITREGAIDLESAPMPSVPELSNAAETNTKYAVGRYAYAIYDVGGLIDITVAGSPKAMPPDFKGKRGLLPRIDIAPLFGTGSEAEDKAEALIQWRNKTSAATSATYETHVTLNTTGFTEVANGDDTFINRQDLIRYAQKYGLTDALPYMTTFAKALDAPSYTPLPLGTGANQRPPVKSQTPPLPTRGLDDEFNPSLINLRDNKGSPFISKRFPLIRLSKINRDATANAGSEIAKYFGLTRSLKTDPWVYNHGAQGRILRLEEVVTQQREPDFFEMLQACIHVGSLGKAIGNTYVNTQNYDQDTYRQILQIGANLIDQYDTDSFPTAIQFPTTPVSNFSGIENLPYLTRVFDKYYRPTSQPSDVYHWFQPEVWNPHQRSAASAGPSAIRFVAVGTSSLNIFTAPPRPSVFLPMPALGGGVRFTPSAAYNTPTIPSPTSGASATGKDVMVNGLVSFIGIYTDQSTAPEGVGWGICPLVPSGTSFYLQYLDGSTWITYNRWETVISSDLADGGANLSAGDNATAALFYICVDPRSTRFGVFGDYSHNDRRGGSPAYPADAIGSTMRPDSLQLNNYGSAPSLPLVSSLYAGWGKSPLAGNPDGRAGRRFGYLTDNKNTLPFYYADPDEVVRKGDAAYAYNGYGQMLDTVNSVPAGLQSRPIILDRPFRSVADMGYAFRDVPFKSLDFFTAESADAALLDAFCLNETPDSAVVSGVFNLNTRQKPAMKAILNGVFKNELDNNSNLTNEADVFTSTITSKTATSPLLNRSELVTKICPVLYPSGAQNPDSAIKFRRETAIRALSDVGDTRTWNLLIDVITQSGRYTQNASNLDEFMVEGERRYWLHVAIDRYTGKVISQNLEPVYE